MSVAAPFAPIGGEGVLAQLRQLWADGAGPRTLLFAGPESVGRRQAARWLAAYVNCSAAGERPCGACQSCRLLAQGAHPDYKEVTPSLTTTTGRAKRRLEVRIDQLVPRERGEAEPLGPWLLTRPRYAVRVGVIDHADAMNAAAANAILKLLEEPPSWALIVLVAPGPEALLPTVASRAATVRFAPVDQGLLAGLEGAEPGHPAVRLGQPGLLLRAAEEGRSRGEARAAALAFLEGVEGELSEALVAAEAFAKEVTAAAGERPGPLGWLKEELRRRGGSGYVAALEAVDRVEEALESYAQASLALTVLALELREVLT